MLIFDFPDIILKVLIGVYSLYSEVKLLLDFLTDRHFCGGSKKSFFHGFHRKTHLSARESYVFLYVVKYGIVDSEFITSRSQNSFVTHSDD